MYLITCTNSVCKKTYGIDFSSYDERTKVHCRYCDQPIRLRLNQNDNDTSTQNAPGDTAKKDILSINNSITKYQKRVTLRKRFNIALIYVLLCSVVTSVIASGYILNQNAKDATAKDARFLLATIEASRSFTGDVVKPVLNRELPGKFVVEAMSSSFGSKSIFERIKARYPEYYFKHAVINPRNRENLADVFEVRVIEEFAKNSGKKEWHGYRDINGERDFMILKPIVAEERCLKCHSVPEKAPREIIAKYGDKAAFGMTLGDVMGALSVSVPATEYFQKARKHTIMINLIFLLCFVSLIIIINIFFQRMIIRPIQRLSKMVDDIGTGNTAIRIRTDNNDEINDLARGVERMRTSINLALKRLGRKSTINRFQPTYQRESQIGE